MNQRLPQHEIDAIMRNRTKALDIKRQLATMPTQPTDPIETVAARCFTGNYNISDIRYMAMAIMQMNDALGELRERVRRLEERE